MPNSPDTLESVWAEHESVIRRFEEAWEQARPDLAAAIPDGVREPRALLAELVQIDLEFRYRAGERPRVEEYLTRFPALADERVAVELIASELALRDRHGPPYAADELTARFPHLGTRLLPLLTTRVQENGTRTRGGGGPWLGAKPQLPGYEIGEQLGRGGMGVVYRAEQASPARTVAVKTLLSVPGERTVARFRREAEAMARLDHPHIVPVYEVGEWECGSARLPYFTMKWYPGGSLDTAPCGPGTPPADHARTVEVIAHAVHHAHQRGVLHRDLKPSNILIDDAGQPAVGDFGLAGWFDPDAPAQLSTTVVGTPAFMAPEQVRDPARVTTAADVYGLGAILYHQLTGRPPFDAPSSLAVMSELGTRPPTRPSALNPAVPRDLETVCLKCLEPDPRNRYASAEAVGEDLARWRSGESITARRAGVWERGWRAVRRHPVVTGLSVATAAAVVTALVTLSVSVARIREKEAETAATLQREQRALYLERVASAGRLYQMNHLEQAWHTLSYCPGRLREWEWDYLDGLRRNSGGDPLRHPEGVVATGFLADGRVATADRTGQVRVWDEWTPRSLTARGTALRTHPGQNLIAVRDAKRLRVLDTDTDAVLFDTPAQGWFDFTPDGKRLAVADGPTVRLFAVGTWGPAGELVGHEQTVWAGVFTADGTTLYTGSLDRSVVVWDVDKTEVRGRWKRELPVQALWLTADGRSLIESSPSRLSLTDTESGETRRLSEAANSRPTLIPTYDSALFASLSAVGEIQLRPLDGGEPTRVYRGHAGVVLAATISRDGKRMVTGGEDATVRVWDLTTTPEYTDLATLSHRFGSLGVSADGRLLAVASRNVHVPKEPDVVVFDAATGGERYRVPGLGDAGFDPRGRWLVAGRADGSVSVCDQSDGREQRALPGGTRPPVQVVFRPDGGALAAVEILGPVRVWDTGTWGVTEYTPANGKTVSAVSWSPDGTRLAVAEGDAVVIWEPGTGRVVERMATANTPLVCEFSPDGRLIAVAGRGRSLELFDAVAGLPRFAFVGNPSVVNAIAFHPTAPRMASVGVNGYVRVWDTETGKEVLTLSGGGDLFGAGWSPDGKHLYATGPTVRRWTGAE